MASRNCTTNRGMTLVVYCPKCAEKMQIVLCYGGEENGRRWRCTKCDFDAKFFRKDYKDYQHTWVKE